MQDYYTSLIQDEILSQTVYNRFASYFQNTNT